MLEGIQVYHDPLVLPPPSQEEDWKQLARVLVYEVQQEGGHLMPE